MGLPDKATTMGICRSAPGMQARAGASGKQAPAEARRRRGGHGGDFLDRMYRIDRMGGSASSDWMGGARAEGFFPWGK